MRDCHNPVLAAAIIAGPVLAAAIIAGVIGYSVGTLTLHQSAVEPAHRECFINAHRECFIDPNGECFISRLLNDD